METASTASAATPAQSDSLALRDRRGASAGVAADLRRPATRLPHHAPCGATTAERFYATGDEPVAGGDAIRRPLCLCLAARRTRPSPHVCRQYLMPLLPPDCLRL